jgi:hypothetical protein
MAAAGADAEAKGREYVVNAEKKLKEFSLFNKAGKFEEASELFAKGAAQFKIAKKCAWRGTIFEGAAAFRGPRHSAVGR